MAPDRARPLELEIDIGKQHGGGYEVTARSPLGDARGTLALPFTASELALRLKDIENAVLRSTSRLRVVLGPNERVVQEFGAKLTEALFSREIRDLYIASLAHARNEQRGLRLRLTAAPAELEILPWELLHDPVAGRELCLSRHTPLVRHVRAASVIPPVAVAPPLRLLAVASSPREMPPLDIRGEKARIHKATQRLRDAGLLAVRWVSPPTAAALQAALRERDWHIMHFAGHAGFDERADEGVIVMEAEDGAPHYLSATALGALLGDLPSLRLVVLNACEGARSGGRSPFSSTASILLRYNLPAVLAMQYPISDWAATTFVKTFYEAVAEGEPIDAAVCEARKAILIARSIEWATPALYMRPGDGGLFELGQAQRTRRRPWLGAGIAASGAAAAVLLGWSLDRCDDPGAPEPDAPASAASLPPAAAALTGPVPPPAATPAAAVGVPSAAAWRPSEATASAGPETPPTPSSSPTARAIAPPGGPTRKAVVPGVPPTVPLPPPAGTRR